MITKQTYIPSTVSTPSCEKHPESDKLLVEQIDIGEEVGKG
jgi:hypothetical protein